MNLVEIEKINFKFNNNFNEININDLIIKKGEICIIKGNSGAGKSTLMEVIFRELNGLPQVPFISIKSLILNKKTEVSAIFQKSELQIFAFSVREELLLKYAFDGMNRKERREIGEEIKNKFNLKDLYERDPRKLSTGQMKKIITIANMGIDKKLILMDEPLSYLDDENADLMKNWIIELSKDGYGFLICTHSDEFDEYANIEIELTNEIPTFNHHNNHNISKITHDISVKKIIGHFGYKNYWKKFINKPIKNNGIYVIEGINGAGKTCLLETLAGVTKEIDGKIRIKSKKIGFLHQNPSYVFSKDSIKNEFDGGNISEYFLKLKNKSPFQLSEGQQKLLGIELILKSNYVCLLDEPFQNLDSTLLKYAINLLVAHSDYRLIFITINRSILKNKISQIAENIINMEEKN
tara:strand:+ start:122 stop:1348 length:1227 start_codon:yes stop_codon:yes gene_type:complete